MHSNACGSSPPKITCENKEEKCKKIVCSWSRKSETHFWFCFDRLSKTHVKCESEGIKRSHSSDFCFFICTDWAEACFVIVRRQVSKVFLSQSYKILWHLGKCSKINAETSCRWFMKVSTQHKRWLFSVKVVWISLCCSRFFCWKPEVSEDSSEDFCGKREYEKCSRPSVHISKSFSHEKLFRLASKHPRKHQKSKYWECIISGS